MKRLYVLYDPNCGLCTRIKHWLTKQPAYIPLIPVPAESETAARLFPTLAAMGKTGELAVISDSGEAYFGNHAWIMCLYALREYRAMARRLASPMLLPLAREGFLLVSRYRHSVARSLKLIPEEEMRKMLKGSAPHCAS